MMNNIIIIDINCLPNCEDHSSFNIIIIIGLNCTGQNTFKICRGQMKKDTLNFPETLESLGKGKDLSTSEILERLYIKSNKIKAHQYDYRNDDDYWIHC